MPIIVVSARSEDFDKVSALDAGENIIVSEHLACIFRKKAQELVLYRSLNYTQYIIFKERGA